MRRLFALCSIAFGATTPLLSQTAMPAPGERTILLSQDRPGGMNVVLGLKQSDFYLGQPSASVPAEPVVGATLMASRFSIRAWTEGGAAKVVVYAVLTDATPSTREIETPIGVYILTSGRTARVTETANWGAAPIVLRLVQRLTR